MRNTSRMFVATTIFLVLGTTVVTVGEDRITVAGCSTVLPIVAEAAEEFKKMHPGVEFVLGGGGSERGIEAAATGEVAIGMASRDLIEKEKTDLDGLVSVTIGMDGIAIVANSNSPITEITKQQVQDIYAGRIRNWKEFGGDDAPITILISKEEGPSTRDLFLKYFDLEAKEIVDGGQARAMVHRRKGTEEYSNVKARLVGSNRAAAAVVSLKKHAIACFSLGAAREVARKGGRIKTLDLDGIAATIENVANEDYPLRRPLNVVTHGTAQGVVKDFITFLTGGRGQTIVSDFEFVSIEEDAQDTSF